jgi:small subunit ribosomal protein S2
MKETTQNNPKIEELFKAGAHFGFSKSRRHPSSNKYIFGSKNRMDIFDLEKTNKSLEEALEFVKNLAKEKSTILFIGGKNEAQNIIKEEATKINMPYVCGRWIGGTLTNFVEIRKRVDTMLDFLSQKEKGELTKYTKKERLLIDRKVDKLQRMFGGIKDMNKLPKAVFIVDPRFEKTALNEAKMLNIKVVALCGSDNDLSNIDFPIPANDTNISSIKYFVNQIVETYRKSLVL